MMIGLITGMCDQTVGETLSDEPTYQDLQNRVLDLEKTVSELRRERTATQEREDIHRSLLEKAIDGMVIIQDFKVKYSNHRLREMLGLEVEELEDSNFLDYIPLKHRATVTNMHQRHLHDETAPARTEFVVKHKDGHEFIVETSTSQISYHGKPAVFATLRDTTDRKTAERILRENVESFRILFDLSFDGLMLHESGNILKANQTVSTMTGYDVDEMEGMLVTDLITPEMRDDMISHMQVPGEHSYETIGLKKDGSTFPVEVRRKPLVHRGSTVILGSIRDISQQKETESTILRNEKKYRTLFHNAQVGIFRTRLSDGVVLEANRRITEMFGYEFNDEIIDKVSVVDLYADSKTRDRMFSELDKNGEIRNFEAEFISKNGPKTWIRFSGVVNLPEGYLDGVANDITEIKNAEIERIKIEEQYRQAQKAEAIGRLAGGVAHDMNNLLVPIVGYSELLLRHFGPNDRFHHPAKQISEAADRCRDLVQQLLAFGRKQTLEYQSIDINHAIVDFGQLLKRTIRENIEIKTVLSPDIETIKADIGQIEQVIMNLCVNAQDAMPDGGKLVMETALVEIDKDYVLTDPGVETGRYVVLAVSDTGCGMDEATKKQIFEPFFSTKGTRGTGLGLATVYGIVMQHGGNITVYSEIGKGTTFKIYLPASEEIVEAIENREVSVEKLQGTETVLLVEDDQNVLDLGAHALEEFGYLVLTAKDGPEALKMLASYSGTIHLLLTDVIMPGMNGRQLFENAIETVPELRVLYMSGYTDNVIAHHGVLKEGVRLLQKPFSVRGLAIRVREVLEA